jgi:4-methylaminobutanoate oxidase (formaldehyde-forming)
MNQSRSAKTVVVGGGIWGLSTAYHLASAGHRDVVVIERGSSVAAETTRRAAGQIGQLRTNPVLVRAINYTLDLMREFQDKTGHDPHYTQSGSLHVALNSARAEFFQQQSEHARTLGLEVETASSDLLSELAPNLNQAAIESALYVPNDGYVEAEQCALAYAAALKDLNVEVRTDTELTGICEENGRVSRVETTSGSIECEQLVVTVGPWARRVLLLAGIHVPMQPILLQQARTEKTSELSAKHPVVRIPDESCYLRPEKGGYLFGCFDPNPKSMDLAALPAEFTTKDIPPQPELVGNSRRRLTPVIPILEKLAIDQYRQGNGRRYGGWAIRHWSGPTIGRSLRCDRLRRDGNRSIRSGRSLACQLDNQRRSRRHTGRICTQSLRRKCRASRLGSAPLRREISKLLRSAKEQLNDNELPRQQDSTTDTLEI